MPVYPLSANPKATSQLLSQRYNNKAAFCIDAGKFDVAIRGLTKALQIASSLNDRPICDCGSCSLEACLTFSQTYSSISKSRRNGNLKRSEEEGFVYKQPIRVSPHSMNHSMGAIFPLVVTFNLALAHHLNAIEEKTEKDRQRNLQKALKLYELGYRWLVEEEIDSLPFAMIIANNLAEAHRAANNPNKCEKCLQNLLSTMMYMLVADDDLEAVGEMVDGFVQNICPLILQGRCAGAA
jgi:tetratricopeptide (TPR) repeat protein